MSQHTHTRTHTHTHTYTETHTHILASACVRVCVVCDCVHVCAYWSSLRARSSAHMRVTLFVFLSPCTCVGVRVRACVCVCVCVNLTGPADIPHLPPDRVHYACLLTGTQIVSKGRQSQDKANHISVTLAVLRLPTVRSDVLITLNSPVVISTTSQAAESAGAGFKQRHLYAGTLMRQILGSLTVVDWGLFGQ